MSIARRLLGTGAELEPFIFEITTTSSDTEITLPLVEVTGFSFNFDVDWGDSNSSTVTSFDDLNRIHTYTTAGTYSVEIFGLCPGFQVRNGSIAPYITDITQWGTVGFKRLNFHGCLNLTSLPDGEAGLSTVIDFASAFRSTGITTIPSNLFQFATSATIFSDAFSFTAITAIPDGLFDGAINATSFSSAFNSCSSLTAIPDGLFAFCPNVINFSGTFRRCNGIIGIPDGLFDDSDGVTTTFESVFEMSTTNALVGPRPALWERTPEPYGFRAFRNCFNLDDYAAIPSNWK
jgi:hypothetical protein